MSPPRIRDELLRETVDAYRAHNENQVHTAAALDISRAGLQNRLRLAAKRGMLGFKPVLPGFAVRETSAQTDAAGNVEKQWIRQVREPGDEFAVPAGHIVKGVSALVDQDGREIAKWIKTREGELDPFDLADRLKESFVGYEPAATVSTPPKVVDEDLLTLYPLADFHLGMYGWHREVGENWDLKKAERTIGAALDQVIGRSPTSAQGIVLGGGDLLHSDNNENKTAHSGNSLQVDGRYAKCVDTACRLVVRTTDAALRKHDKVTVRILPGNHDEHAATAVAYFLHAWYRQEPRVTVDTDPSLFWWYRFGSVLFGATHGHTVKISDMPGIMAHRRAEEWGATKFRYIHGFHLHHKERIATEGNGVVCEIHQTPIPQDAWHYGCGFLSGRSIKSITYHRRFGEWGFDRQAILDGEA